MIKWFYLMVASYIVVKLLTKLIELGFFNNEEPSITPKQGAIGFINFVALIITIVAVYNLWQ
jgi:hypothetical protein